MKNVNIMINNFEVTVPAGTNIFDAAKMSNITIPHLCYHPDTHANASCGLCLVKIDGRGDRMFRSCVTEVEEGMSITTNDNDLFETRRAVLELILSNHPQDCLKCLRNQNCELQKLAADFGMRESVLDNIVESTPKDLSTPSLVLDKEKCVLCGRCVDVCQSKQNVYALEFISRGNQMKVAPAGNIKLNDSPCIKCGQCSAHCPVGAIVEHSHAEFVWKGLNDPELYPIVQIAPAVRVAFAEAFKGDSGDIVTKKMYSLLRHLGFKAVFDTNFAADVTIMEEAAELVELVNNKAEELPLITSCCPSWVDYLEKFYPDLISYFSTAHSPQEMLGALAKTYFAEAKKIDPKKIFSVSVMPCTAKKYEVSRTKEMSSSGHQNVDVSITTRELVRMCKSAGIDFDRIEEGEADSILGEYTGAGTIFGTTGGVMEAALRTAHYFVTKKELKDVEFHDVRGTEGIRETEVEIGGKKLKVAVANGVKNVSILMDRIAEAKEQGKEMPYQFIEVMACEGGCVGGGGQPYGVSREVRIKRSQGLYDDDRQAKKRCSYQNPEVKILYKKYLGKPGGEKAHKLLHTSYQPRPLYRK